MSRHGASLSVGVIPPRTLTFVPLQQSDVWSFAVAVPPRDDVGDPPEDNKYQCINICEQVITSVPDI